MSSCVKIVSFDSYCVYFDSFEYNVNSHITAEDLY